MGCEFDITTLKGVNSPDQIPAAFDKVVEAAAYDFGHAGYTGTFAEAPGVEVVTDPSFASDEEDQAIEWLQENTDKWDNAKAVKCGDRWVVGGWFSS